MFHRSEVGRKYWSVMCDYRNCLERSEGRPTKKDAVLACKKLGTWYVENERVAKPGQHLCPAHREKQEKPEKDLQSPNDGL